jgi:hypothetical protein
MSGLTTTSRWFRRSLMAAALVSAGALTIGATATPASAQGYYPYYAYYGNPYYSYYSPYYSPYYYPYAAPAVTVGWGWGWGGGRWGWHGGHHWRGHHHR